MDSNSRDWLREQLIDVLSQQNEIFQIFSFGREVEERVDAFSDLDIIVCSSDLAQTQNTFKSVISTISPIVGTYIIESSTDNLSEMIMLRGYSPYQKIDFSIVNDIELKKRLGFGPLSLIYENGQAQRQSRSVLDVVEIPHTINQLNDLLFSVPRFTKCLFRADIDMYRRWKSSSDLALVLLYERYYGWDATGSRKKISAKEANILYKGLNQEDSSLLEAIFPITGQLSIAASYVLCIDLLIELSKQKAEFFELEANDELIRYVRTFLDIEIGRIQVE
ncbi:MAG: hypothetical protein H6670_11870 [Anaerolineaceae bacterium]|nr:hypothetical protein [Anaerolineaceae bacterium]